MKSYPHWASGFSTSSGSVRHLDGNRATKTDHSTIIYVALTPMGYKPLEAQSAGLVSPGTCCHLSGGISSITSATRFPTKGLNRQGLPRSQLRTTVLSVQAKVSHKGTSTTFLQWLTSFAVTTAPHSSNRGILKVLIGATLVVAITSDTYLALLVSMALK